MTLVLLLVAACLAAVAAAGILHPFRRGRAIALQPQRDPLEDERRSLLRSLRELDDERAMGLLADSDYRALRTETERRAVSVLRTLEARDRAGLLASDLKALRPAPAEGLSGNGSSPGRRFGTVPALVVVAAILGVVVPLLVGAVRSRSADQPLTGDSQTQADPLQFFQDRVRHFPRDVAARLDLANAYLQTGDVEDSVSQYLQALKLDPKNPEARATLGYLLYRAGKAQEGLDAVNQALAVAPNFPEALYFKGLILLDGLHRPAEAAAALRAYLAAAPFDSAARRQSAQRLLTQAEGQSG